MDQDGFHSIAWDDAPSSNPPLSGPSPSQSPFEEGFESISPSSAQLPISEQYEGYDNPKAGGAGEVAVALDRRERLGGHEVDGSIWNGKWMDVQVREPAKEHEGSKDMYVSYAVKTETSLPTFRKPLTVVRRRFQDFVFLREHLVKNFPACVVPPIPDKHRLEYIKGDRFSPEFVERRRLDLQRFADRIARHPTLQRSQLVNDFLQSTEWSVAKHHHISHPPPESHTSLIDSLSDTFINAFTRVRKPDARFVEMTEELERFEEGLTGVERVVGRGKSRVDDLAADYQDMAAAYQGLGYLESGITEPLNRFAEKMLDFSTLLKHMNNTTIEPFLSSSHSLLSYSATHRNVIKLRDQKQLDFEELSAYLSAIVSERDRLAALSSGHTAAPVGLGTYLRDQVDKLRGTDDIHTRRERMRKMDGKIRELQDAVTLAHETSNAFSEEVIKEHAYFELEKKQEMKDALQAYADGQVEMLQQAMDDWDRIIPLLQRIRVDV
ncbi:sorting nexin-4 [Cryptococcus neoformans]|uniref:Sorting nexin-4 n=1 Tax=Cryptococcus neoformans Tu259-1 TaxID=1230072 RepID=A0A854QBJ0_CRYNE|nr:sorting nexin-4 [Cryptococcus neoformans var. grubii AD1-83a]OXG12974.1 sorting nexin-4 [Cryptococcus neoformans var. grubii Tu259-1]OXG46025.1 sorting nexin-4 [Cryptococcus neoformans var. grubii Th84]OXG50458.1 sorting nexin-4 [Cryptococcus neoformans var. grubii MW-RSA1955]OXG53892.1 sorting nexin-4 [Cryptococcus neoformans var. grubii CHC193]OXG58671.1 sorting nexin-4 [Cryptococcus neoformans var. grubii c8]OXG79322.1 sorting nexin-4 [Cryptococcus neoformans var. grubii D17-1]OXG92113